MKLTQIIFLSIFVVSCAFLFGNIDAAMSERSKIDMSSSIERNILEHTGMYIKLN